MVDVREELGKLEEVLLQQRDELRVKLHLAKADASDEWKELEQKWAEAQVKFDQVRKSAGESVEEIEVAARLLGDEIKKGYERIRRLF